jgi:hypothetical protein
MHIFPSNIGDLLNNFAITFRGCFILNHVQSSELIWAERFRSIRSNESRCQYRFRRALSEMQQLMGATEVITYSIMTAKAISRKHTMAAQVVIT